MSPSSQPAARFPRAELAELIGASRLEAFEQAGALVAASAPGRVELAGNHTDHQGGCTISAAIGQRVFGLAAPACSEARRARIAMEGFGEAVIELSDLDPRPEERGTSAALARGMLAGYARSGRGELREFTLAVASDLPVGRGVSSSAAFEMMVGLALCRLFDAPGAPAPDPIDLALWGSHVEQAYFGKLAGAQDQLASAFGGVSLLDFAEERPARTALEFDPQALGGAFVLVDSRCDHAAHTDEFSSVSRDMVRVAAHFGATRLIEVPYPEFLAALPAVRAQEGDRPALRALHFYEETRRVKRQAAALRTGDTARFLQLMRQSGASSAQFLQNVTPTQDTTGADQPATLVLALCAHLLDGEGLGRDRGAYRIHGGGFGGSVLAFVPDGEVERFVARMNGLLAGDVCSFVALSPQGACADRA